MSKQLDEILLLLGRRDAEIDALRNEIARLTKKLDSERTAYKALAGTDVLLANAKDREEDLKARLKAVRVSSVACCYSDDECTDAEVILKRATDLRIKKWRKP